MRNGGCVYLKLLKKIRDERGEYESFTEMS
jgi:hypothetical protein